MSIVHDLISRNRAGEAVGLPCFCTANEQVLRAVLAHAARTGRPTVIEATCNQVNQDGGYTGMTPADFMGWLSGMAADAGLSMDKLILGGDHLGPNPWRRLPADQAMDRARELVRLYVQAGFTKIHLDASMACGGEPTPDFASVAARAAALCAVAEAHAPDPERLVYVIGTEVPVPGGETDEPDTLDVTSVDRLAETIHTHRAAWSDRGLDAAWGRIVSVVTQPGVDFGHSSVYAFDPQAARPLGQAIIGQPGLTFEAHSTDYQSTHALAALVAGHFFFLKVGPELTFRFREAVWALAGIEAQLFTDPPSNLQQVVRRRMAERPGDWQDYYSGTEDEVRRQQIFSYSDRIRYYWTDPQIAAALRTLLATLRRARVPETLVSQAFGGLEFGAVPTDPDDLIAGHVLRCVSRYFQAAGHGVGGEAGV